MFFSLPNTRVFGDKIRLAVGLFLCCLSGLSGEHDWHLLTLEDHYAMNDRASWHIEQVVHYLEMAEGPYNRLTNPEKRQTVKEGILGAIPGVLAGKKKAAWMGAMVSVLNGSMGDAWTAYYDAMEYFSKAEYHADCAEEIYALLEEDWERRAEKNALDLERAQL